MNRQRLLTKVSLKAAEYLGKKGSSLINPESGCSRATPDWFARGIVSPVREVGRWGGEFQNFKSHKAVYPCCASLSYRLGYEKGGVEGGI